MATTHTRQPQSLEYYLSLTYPYSVVPTEGSFFVEFPDLPGCMTQVDEPAEIAEMAEEIRTLWIETEYERGAEIPEPIEDERFSGKFLVRVAKSLHRDLTRAAQREGVSLNAYVTTMLAQRNATTDAVQQLATMLAGHQQASSVTQASPPASPYEVSVTAPETTEPKSSDARTNMYLVKAVAA